MTTKLKLLFASLAFAGITTLSAQIVGYVTVNITPSPDGTTVASTLVSSPLLQQSTLTGNMAGTIASVTSNTITVTSAGWTASQLVTSGPTYILLTSGTQEGLLLRITANTADTLTVDTEGLSLTTLAVASGTSFTIYQADTLLSVFGTPSEGIIGGNATQFAAGQTDKVVLKDTLGVIRTYYYNTDFSQWRRSGSSSDQGSVPISPYSGVVFYRIGTAALSIVSPGTVPSSSLRQLVPVAGTTILARYFPTDTTLGALGLQNLAGWRNTSQGGVTITSADKVIAKDSLGVIRTFYYDGTNWRRSGSGSSQNSAPITAGSAIYTTRFGTGTVPEILTAAVPY